MELESAVTVQATALAPTVPVSATVQVPATELDTTDRHTSPADTADTGHSELLATAQVEESSEYVEYKRKVNLNQDITHNN